MYGKDSKSVSSSFEEYVFLIDTAKMLSQKAVTIGISIGNCDFCSFLIFASSVGGK